MEKELTIIVVDEDGKEVDRYLNVRTTDADSTMFFPEITKWLARTIRNYRTKPQ